MWSLPQGLSLSCHHQPQGCKPQECIVLHDDSAEKEPAAEGQGFVMEFQDHGYPLQGLAHWHTDELMYHLLVGQHGLVSVSIWNFIEGITCTWTAQPQICPAP